MIRKMIEEAERVLIGLGPEWALADDGQDVRARRLSDLAQTRLRQAYEALYELVKDKDYYLVTTVTDGAVLDSPFGSKRVSAPCGNIHWRQCSESCTKDIWEEGEVPSDICPHCGAPLTGNTIKAKNYIEEGYLPAWESCKKWQGATMNRRLVMLELGVGFESPGVIRWPFERIAMVSKKSCLVRVNEEFSQIPAELAAMEGRSVREAVNSVDWVLGLRR